MNLLMKRLLTTGLLSMAFLWVMAQQTVKGTVTDAQGDPLIGVSVVVDGKPVTVTDAEGRFTISQAKAASKLEFSYIGYESQKVSVCNRNTINIALKEDSH